MKGRPTRHVSNMDLGLDPVTEMQFEESSLSTYIPSVPIVQGLGNVTPVVPSTTPGSTLQGAILLGAMGDEQSEVVTPAFSEAAPQPSDVLQHFQDCVVDSPPPPPPPPPRLIIHIPPSLKRVAISATAPTQEIEMVSETPSAPTQEAGRETPRVPKMQSSGKRRSRPKGLSAFIAITEVVRSSARIRAQRNTGMWGLIVYAIS